MCILCEPANLRLLVTPLPELSLWDLAESVRVGREAAMQFVLDATDALGALEDAETLTGHVSAAVYIEYIVERAERDGVADPDLVRQWNGAVRDHHILQDARVQAFLSSAAEGMAAYALQLREHREVLERYLEVLPGALEFSGIGPNGEVSFDLGTERFVVLSDDEAHRIAVDRLTSDLWKEDPDLLLLYTNLPDGAVDVLTSMQKRPQEQANDVLAGIVDVHALADDWLRKTGCGRFVAEGLTDDFSEQRFGDRLIVRLHLSQQPEEED